MRVHEKVMERYTETRDEQQWRPDLGQCVAQYHRGLVTHIGTCRVPLTLNTRVNKPYRDSVQRASAQFLYS